MVVCPAVPDLGDEVTDRVSPSTLPVAGRPGTVVVVDRAPVVVVGLPVVVVEDELEFEHPASVTTESARTAAATGMVRGRGIGSS
jgi:hypothetical protein